VTTMAVESREPIFRARGSRVASLRASRVASNSTSAGKRRVPMFIPAHQVYYWSSQWQRDEAESMADLKAGRARTFDDPQDAIRHLLSDD
jgi:hypothetical protein